MTRAPTGASAPGSCQRTRPGIERLLATGWTDSWRAPRLVRGDPLTWQPEAIWGQFNHALG